MKSTLSLFLAVLAGLNIHAQEIAYPERENLTSNFQLIIQQIPEVKGEVRIAIFDSKNAYDSKEEPLHALVLPVDGTQLTWNDDSLPYGNYAIAVYHDKNENGELDTNLLGIPKEAYGFSNNARGRFGPASWEDAHFTVDADQANMVIEIE